jgi:hypothetical protein
LFLSNRNNARKSTSRVDQTIGEVALENPSSQTALPHLGADGSEIAGLRGKRDSNHSGERNESTQRKSNFSNLANSAISTEEMR